MQFDKFTLKSQEAIQAAQGLATEFGNQEITSAHLTKAILGTAALQALVSYLPMTRQLLGTTPLALADLGAIAAGVVGPLIINEATKPSYKPEKEQVLESDAETGSKQLKEEPTA
jgi:ATP-dependent Clp protease ATP-binding subunit ClpB